ncbi:hypothetical protein Aab01nite_65510 [Paractinoplanes abujensis]|uniref:Uncharacterized protein n=1 Tax=Paractinoplanes abujensis TaxID=882441 RepID=A0A7W7CT91_9ACTN|nr:hypothetical protein [Actinoplanes abujensis]GID22961.1 hypothetical protein Aab01nite_65510 [Actinoplanes abujensis]
MLVALFDFLTTKNVPVTQNRNFTALRRRHKPGVETRKANLSEGFYSLGRYVPIYK